MAGAYFVTAETWQRRKLFLHEEDVLIFLETLADYRVKGFYLLHDFVVMPDHFHAILTPGRDVTLEKTMQMIKGGSSHRIGARRSKKSPVWQPGFHEHWVRSKEDYGRCRQYIEMNPVKAGLTTAPAAYPFSSASGHYELDAWQGTSGAEAPGEGTPPFRTG